MKKTVTLLLSCLLLACTAAGCGSKSNNQQSSAGSPSAESSAQNSGAAEASPDSTTESTPADENTDSSAESALSEETDDTEEDPTDSGSGGITIDEDGNITIDPTQIDDWNDPDEPGETVQNQYLINGYQVLYLSPEHFGADSQLPAAYVLKSSKEREEFINTYGTSYSLTTSYSDNEQVNKSSFTEITNNMDESYFESFDALIVVAAYSKSKSPDVDMEDINEEGSTVRITFLSEEPSDASDTGYLCWVVPAPKNALSEKQISVQRITPLKESDQEAT